MNNTNNNRSGYPAPTLGWPTPNRAGPLQGIQGPPHSEQTQLPNTPALRQQFFDLTQPQDTQTLHLQPIALDMNYPVMEVISSGAREPDRLPPEYFHTVSNASADLPVSPSSAPEHFFDPFDPLGSAWDFDQLFPQTLEWDTDQLLQSSPPNSVQASSQNTPDPQFPCTTQPNADAEYRATTQPTSQINGGQSPSVYENFLSDSNPVALDVLMSFPPPKTARDIKLFEGLLINSFQATAMGNLHAWTGDELLAAHLAAQERLTSLPAPTNEKRLGLLHNAPSELLDAMNQAKSGLRQPGSGQPFDSATTNFRPPVAETSPPEQRQYHAPTSARVLKRSRPDNEDLGEQGGRPNFQQPRTPVTDYSSFASPDFGLSDDEFVAIPPLVHSLQTDQAKRGLNLSQQNARLQLSHIQRNFCAEVLDTSFHIAHLPGILDRYNAEIQRLTHLGPPMHVLSNAPSTVLQALDTAWQSNWGHSIAILIETVQTNLAHGMTPAQAQELGLSIVAQCDKHLNEGRFCSPEVWGTCIRLHTTLLAEFRQLCPHAEALAYLPAVGTSSPELLALMHQKLTPQNSSTLTIIEFNAPTVVGNSATQLRTREQALPSHQQMSQGGMRPVVRTFNLPVMTRNATDHLQIQVGIAPQISRANSTDSARRSQSGGKPSTVVTATSSATATQSPLQAYLVDRKRRVAQDGAVAKLLQLPAVQAIAEPSTQTIFQFVQAIRSIRYYNAEAGEEAAAILLTRLLIGRTKPSRGFAPMLKLLLPRVWPAHLPSIPTMVKLNQPINGITNYDGQALDLMRDMGYFDNSL